MSTIEKLRFTEFTDLLVARLYDKDQQSPGEMFDLNLIASEVNAQVPDTWVFDAAKVLQSRGLALPIFTFGAIWARLTGEGRAFVEEENGTGVIAKYHQSPGTYLQNVNVVGNNNQTIVGRNQRDPLQTGGSDIEKEREPVFRILQELLQKLDQDRSIRDDERAQFKEDVQYIREQLRRREPNRPALAALLAPLSQLTSLASHVLSLIRLLNS